MALKAGYRRRALSMTSLIDVIFLLLLFFMLSSTFSKFAEVELASVGERDAGAAEAQQPLFLQVTPDDLRLNAALVAPAQLPAQLAELLAGNGGTLMLSMSGDVTSQRLTDVLVILRAQSNLTLSILAPT